jgi:hypothetical protein
LESHSPSGSFYTPSNLLPVSEGHSLYVVSVPGFIARWQAVTLSERSAAQTHFVDLCEVLGEQHPTAADPEGTSYTFEKHVSKTGGGKGYADVCKRDYFA